MKNAWIISVAVCCLLAVGVIGSGLYAATAHAQTEATNASTFAATPRGTIGLGVIGAETGLILASVTRIDRPWALAVFPAVGGAGGAVAGYFLVDNKGKSRTGAGLLVGAGALAIPSILMAVRSVRRGRTDRALRAEREHVRASGGLIARSSSGIRFGVPAISVSRGGIDVRHGRDGGHHVENRTVTRSAVLPDAHDGLLPVRTIHVPLATGVF